MRKNRLQRALLVIIYYDMTSSWRVTWKCFKTSHTRRPRVSGDTISGEKKRKKKRKSPYIRYCTESSHCI